MRRALAAVLALAALGASVLPFVSEARDRRCMRSSRAGRTFDCAGFAFFEAFPAGGAGTTGPCSTTAPTGAKGEALTFTRASTAYCTKTASGGLATTGIADGDLVSMSNNVARVEYDSAGALGLRVEGARTNSTLRSQEFDVAPWTNITNGSTPTLNGANTIVAPDGTTTADDYTFTGWSPSAANYTYRAQTPGCATSTTVTGSVYAKSISGGTTLDLVIYNSAGAFTVTSCTIDTASWTRCSVTATTGASNANFYIGLGNPSVSTLRSTSRVALWQAQCEAGAYATSPILTTTAAAQRAEEYPRFDLGSAIGPASNSASIAGSVTFTSGNRSYAYGPSPFSISTAYPIPISGVESFGMNSTVVAGTVMRCFSFNAAGVGFVTGTVSSASSFRGWCSASGVINGAIDSTSMTASGATSGVFSKTRYVVLGSGSISGTHLDSIISRLCVDPDPTRCR